MLVIRRGEAALVEFSAKLAESLASWWNVHPGQYCRDATTGSKVSVDGDIGDTRVTLVDVPRHSEVIPCHESLSVTKLYENATFKIK